MKHSMRQIGLILASMVISMGAYVEHASAVEKSTVPAGYWKFEEGSGSTVADSSGNGHTGTVYGATWTSEVAPVGGCYAMSFDGNDYVNLNNARAITGSRNSFTISAWIYPTSDSQSRIYIHRADNRDIQFIWSHESDPRVVRWAINDDSDSDNDHQVTSDQLELNQWTHIAGTYDGTTQKLYINGALVASESWTGNINWDNSFMAEGIGGHSATTSDRFTGYIDEVKIYNYARSADQIADDAGIEISLYPPSSVSASDGTYTNKVRVTWSTVTNAASYEVWRNNSGSSSSASKLGDATGTSYDDTSAEADTTYYYWVKSVDSSGSTSGFSASDSGYRASEGTVVSGLEAPTGVSASDGTYTGKVVVSWNAVTDATSYEVWRGVSNSSSSAISLAETTGTNYDDTAVLAGISYYYWVMAKNSEGSSDFSEPDSGYASIGEGSGSADLALSNFILLPTALTAGEYPSILAFLLINYGPDSLAILNTRVQYDFYLSSNTTFGDSDDQFIGAYTTDVTLSAGSYTTVMLSESDRQGVTIPSGLSGNYYAFVKVRHASPSTLSDSDESNNYAMRSGTIAISSSGTSAGYHAINDFDGDNKSDLVVYQESTGYWYIYQSTEGLMYMQWGGSGYMPVSGDYDGDGKSDLTVYDTASGYWLMFLSGSLTIEYQQVGGLEYDPVCGDFDGDGKSDLAVYQESTGYWYVVLSSSGELSSVQFGAAGYEPVCGDFDGDGKTDLAVYHEASGYWYILQSSNFWLGYQKFGACGYLPVPADYDGDGKTDMAVYHQSSGYWYIFYSSTYTLTYLKFGESGYEPISGDFDGDGKTDLTVYHESSGYWFIQLSSSGEISYFKFGEAGYEPVDEDYDEDEDVSSIEGQININPSNSDDNEFTLILTDGTTITRDDLAQDFSGYSGPASKVHVKPAGSGNQNDLIVDGQVYSLSNSDTYDIVSDSMTVDLYNDKVNKHGKATGQWWISITASAATITVSD